MSGRKLKTWNVAQIMGFSSTSEYYIHCLVPLPAPKNVHIKTFWWTGRVWTMQKSKRKCYPSLEEAEKVLLQLA